MRTGEVRAELGWSLEYMRVNTEKEGRKGRIETFYFILKELEKGLGIPSR